MSQDREIVISREDVSVSEYECIYIVEYFNVSNIVILPHIICQMFRQLQPLLSNWYVNIILQCLTQRYACYIYLVAHVIFASLDISTKACVSFYKNVEKNLPPGSGIFIVVNAITGAPLGVFQENRFMTDLR